MHGSFATGMVSFVFAQLSDFVCACRRTPQCAVELQVVAHSQVQIVGGGVGVG
jgi:hypothetical protein